MDKYDTIFAVYFFILFLINLISSKWIMKMAIDVSGVDREEAQEHWNGLISTKHNTKGGKMLRWLLTKADDPKKVKKVWYLGSLYVLPSIICISLSINAISGVLFFGLKTKIYIAVIMTVIVIVFAVISKIYKARLDNRKNN